MGLVNVVSTLTHLSMWLFMQLEGPRFDAPIRLRTLIASPLSSKNVFSDMSRDKMCHSMLCSLYLKPTQLCWFFNLLSVVWRNERRLMQSPCPPCVCVPSSPVNFWITESVYIKSGMFVMALEPILNAYFINFFHQSACLYTCMCIPLSLLGNYLVEVHLSLIGNGLVKTLPYHLMRTEQWNNFYMLLLGCVTIHSSHYPLWKRVRIPAPQPC
jgi:hypothetical protein